MEAGNTGEFFLKDTYNALRHKEVKKKWHKLIWFPHCIPRHCFIVWVSLQRGLKTKFKLLSWGMEVDPVCILCNIMLEDDYHLFFSCSYPVFIRRHILRLLGLRDVIAQDWDKQIDWCVDHIKGGNSIGTIKRLMFNAFIYHVWCERNRRTFSQKSMPAGLLFLKMIEDVRLRLATCKVYVPDNN